MYELINNFAKESSNIVQPKVSLSPNKASLCWDMNKCGTGVAFTDNNTHVFLKEQSYVFRTVIGNIGFDSGVNYWEIIADTKT